MKKTILLLCLLLLATSAYAVPDTINYQGVLTDSVGVPLNQDVSVTFRLYDDATAGTEVWSETQTVTVLNGVYSVQLGQSTSLAGVDFTAPYWLEVEVGGEILTPRQALTSVPYAMTAATAENVNLSSNFTLGSQWISADGDDEGLFVSDSGQVGVGTNSPNANFEVDGIDGALFSGTYEQGSIPAEGAGTRMMWYPKKAAFRVGSVDGTQWDDAQIGNYSVALGVNTTASGGSSIALGVNTTASGDYSTALGVGTTASGDLSTVLGHDAIAESYGETVVGGYDTNYTPASIRGWNTADRLFVVGNGTSDSVRSDALVILKSGNVGVGTSTPSANFEVDGINGVLFSGTYDQGSIPTEGTGTRMMWYPKKAAFRVGSVGIDRWDDVNIGIYSAALGYDTTASGTASVSLGYVTTASGEYSTALGLHTTASGWGSTTLGNSTTAIGNVSIAMGIDTNAISYGETVIGRDNTNYTAAGGVNSWNSTDRLFVVGNGTDRFHPSDAMVILKNGNVGIGTSLPSKKLYIRNNSAGLTYPLKVENLAAGDESGESDVGILFSTGGSGSGNRGKGALVYETTGTWNRGSFHFLQDGGANENNPDITASVMTITNSGRVGIGTSTPSSLLHVAGTITEDSDIRLKENIYPVDSALYKIGQIEGVSFNWRDSDKYDDRTHLGVIAQQVEGVFPEVVFTSDDEAGTKSVDYNGLIAPLIEAVKELKTQNEALQEQNTAFKGLLCQDHPTAAICK